MDSATKSNAVCSAARAPRLSASSTAASVIAEAHASIRRGWTTGLDTSRCLRHSSPSVVNRPRPKMAEKPS